MELISFVRALLPTAGITLGFHWSDRPTACSDKGKSTVKYTSTHGNVVFQELRNSIQIDFIEGASFSPRP